MHTTVRIEPIPGPDHAAIRQWADPHCYILNVIIHQVRCPIRQQQRDVALRISGEEADHYRQEVKTPEQHWGRQQTSSHCAGTESAAGDLVGPLYLFEDVLGRGHIGSVQAWSAATFGSF